MLCASFSPDGTQVVTSAASPVATIWSVEPGNGGPGERWRKRPTELSRHSGLILHASFSPDGKHVVTTTKSFTARLWNAATGEEVSTQRGHLHAVFAAAFSADGRRLMTVSYDKTLRIWPVDPVAAAMKRKPRDLTRAERERFRLEEPLETR